MQFIMRFLQLLSIALAPALCGCVTMGGVAEHVDPVEAQLVKRLSSELCKVNFTYQGKIIKTETVRAAFVGVSDILDTGVDEGRVASLIIKGNAQKVTYNPHTAMAYCGSSPTSSDGFVYYDRVSQTLVDQGGDPEIYFRRVKVHEAYLADEDARNLKNPKPSLQKTRMIDATFPIHVKWEGIAEALVGSIREVRVGSKGAMAIELPESFGICTGEYVYTGHNIGTWKVTCPNHLKASGTFQSGKGAHGEGSDNFGRKITYTIDTEG